MRVWVRATLVVVGVGVFAVYASAALVGYLLLSWLVAGPTDLVVLLASVGLVALVAGYVSYRVGTTRLLRGLQAVELTRRRAPRVYRRLDALAARMGVSRPQLLVARLPAPNALSVGGSRRGVIVLDESLLDLLSVDELAGILAHELAHLERSDAFVQTLAVTLMRTVAGLVRLLLAPVLLLTRGLDRALGWAAGNPAGHRGLFHRVSTSIDRLVEVLLTVLTLAVFAHSRQREFAADERAAAVTGDPAALARSLSKIDRVGDPARGFRSLLSIHGEERDDGLDRILSTHPPIEERIERLLARTE